MSNPIVIDISHWQPDPIDWAKVKANGTIAVIHKATEGTTHIDERLFERAEAALAAGLSWSTYHFLTDSNPDTQMAHYLKTVNPRQGERVCIDHEEDATLDQLKKAVSYIRNARPDLQITIYSGHLIEEQLGNTRDDFLAENTSLWTAQYTSRPEEVEWANETWPVPSLWQYTESAQVEGISGDVDGNRWNGTPEALVKWIGPASEEPAPEPAPESETPSIAMDLTIEGDAQLAITINGVLVWQTAENA